MYLVDDVIWDVVYFVGWFNGWDEVFVKFIELLCEVLFYVCCWDEFFIGGFNCCVLGGYWVVSVICYVGNFEKFLFGVLLFNYFVFLCVGEFYWVELDG